MITSPDPVIADLKRPKLNVDFLEMTLTQNKSGKSAIVYKGTGYIRQTQDDVLTFRLYASQTQNTNAMADFRRLNQTRSGELYPEEAFYTLIGIASDGSQWTADRVLPEPSWNFEHSNPIVSGKLSLVTCGELLPDPKAVTLHFFERADLPMIAREANFEAVGCEFHCENDEDGFVVRAKSSEPLPKHLVMRVEEALRFLLAQSVSPRAIVQPRAVILNSATRKTGAIRLGPPISRGSIAFLKGWRLFETYLAHIVRQTKFEKWNPCSGYVHNAQEASANSLDAWAIGLCVAVEGLASMIKLDEGKVEKKKRDAEKNDSRSSRNSSSNRCRADSVSSSMLLGSADLSEICMPYVRLTV
ncbi:hypothetical protein [Bradyrhizobium australiense]|uniref:ApeA N-terminal domain-containing protein n=1 Tax=Bradyrhizobium australiense TaxID=2721161 RepID=A0A7Y4LW53_9BRAD|nr:hypothetical protein [Bradyrhizobium australiense]NOJ41053.1 hypothetical protein [Bradyrhizobium australiense]